MFELREYQNEILDSLRKFLKLCAQTGNAEASFREITKDEDTGAYVPYEHVNVAGLSGLPYVCLRVPTGGGKTIMGCYAAGIAIREFKRAEHSIVLWLVPSNTILDQTAEALRDPRHPYRRALELQCGEVEVLTIDEALRLSRAMVDGATVVIVATIQSFRVEDKTGRRVYANNGSLQEHFTDIPASRVAELMQIAEGIPVYSLANALKLRRPILIVDEAHNARTPLSFETLAGVAPACIIEFTATPSTTAANRSNVLARASASELKAAQMIKLPVRVITRTVGQKNELLADAIQLRSDLEKYAIAEAQITGEYIRPIVLIQAERLDACEPLRDRMVLDYNVDRDEIKISTSRLDELKNIGDISASHCPVRFIITVEKLREGWDCPFAYVLCSLKETRSATAIEQIVGRILRLPNVSFKKQPELNCAYAFSVSDSIAEVLAELRDALEGNGFTRAEAQRIILPVPQRLPLSAVPETVQFEPEVEIDHTLAEKTAVDLSGKVVFDSDNAALTVLVPLTIEEETAVANCAKTADAKQKLVEAIELVRQRDAVFEGTSPKTASPYMLKMEFFVPVLSVREGSELLPFDETTLLEHQWRLSDKDASLQNYNPSERPTGKEGKIDVNAGGELQTIVVQNKEDFVANLHQQVLDYEAPGDWTIDELVVWIARRIQRNDVTFEACLEFVQRSIKAVIGKHPIDVPTLALDRFRLRDAIDDRINEHARVERVSAFQALLLPESPLAVDSARGIDFRAMLYEPNWLYQGAFKFQKHYFGDKPGELRDGEEGECAQFIDSLPEVKYWVRNLSRKSTSFKLQTSKDSFYPDFICKLIDGRDLVVEYKGQHLYETPDSDEKRSIGKAWEDRSNRGGLFLMLTKKNFSAIKQKIGDVPNPNDFRLT